jgi:DNA-binding beta-propeller fold protein YncE
MTVALNSCAITLSIASALLAACGGSQPPIGVPGAMPQSPSIATHAARGGSWVAPEASGTDLVYTVDNIANQVDIYSYPVGTLYGTLTGFNSPVGACIDKAQNVWIVNQGPAEVIEYAHGGNSPIATLRVPGDWPYGCAVDPTTGNLAVTYNNNNIAIFQNAKGSPTTYVDSSMSWMHYCGYDATANLFLVGDDNYANRRLVELSGNSFTTIALPVNIQDTGAVQWDGQYVAVEAYNWPGEHKPIKIYGLKISGRQATLESTVQLATRLERREYFPQFWIFSKTIVEAANNGRQLNFWHYPAGGRPEKQIKGVHGREFWGTAVSLSQ